MCCPCCTNMPAAGRTILSQHLPTEGVQISTYTKLDDNDRGVADQYFLQHVFPILTPLAVDPGHPFPFISNLSKSLGVMLEHPGRVDPSWIRIKVPENLPRWVPLPGRTHFVPLEQVIAGNLALLFPGMKVLEWGDVPLHAQRGYRNGCRRCRRSFRDG